MSSDVIRVNFTSMTSAADSIEQISKRIDGQLSALRTYCDNATAKWTGDARDGYHRLQRDWDGTAAELNAQLKQVAQGVRTSHGNFTTAETKNTQTWTG